MKALVIYDSIFGNTEKIAQAIGSALGAPGDVQVLRVGDVKPEQLTGLDLLIVGSPTRAFRPTATISQFLGGIPAGGLSGVRVAGFDTRILPEDTGSPILRFMMKLFGWAAKPIADKLVRKGGLLAIPPEGFAVKGSEGPLAEGELERATEWARKIAAAG
ncbi:MAG: flavodoxin family protein [Chloroflexi bacterium]|nr:flavodoxin family protein [Chloroflexota bacterium]